ncbi:MAG: hypothetical protein U1E29_04585 [Coriobacteriia bacterium]|nr:hypothetical protein [Coriobacteriia bacterium]
MEFPGGVDPQRFSTYHDIARLNIERCLAPLDSCNRPAISAHSVQKSRFLKLIADDGHVMAVRMRSTPQTGLVVDFEPVGLGKATAFTGLCAEHDNAIFTPIEKCEVDPSDPEHLFLLAYRSLLKEFHEQIVAASKLQSAYQYRVSEGLDSPDQPSRAGTYATHRIITAYETHQYKIELDNALLARDFSALVHHVVSVKVSRPTVAGSSLYSVDDVDVGDETLKLHFNLLPLSTDETIAVFSYVPRFGRAARRHLRPMLRTDDRRRLHDLSRMTIENCGNLVLSPTFVAGWSTEKREAIVQHFIESALNPSVRHDSPHFELLAPPA